MASCRYFMSLGLEYKPSNYPKEGKGGRDPGSDGLDVAGWSSLVGDSGMGGKRSKTLGS